MKISNLKIGKRLGLGFTVILAFLIMNTALGIYRLQQVADETRAMMEAPLAKERLVSDWYRLVYAGIRRTTAIAKSSDPSLAKFFAPEAAESTVLAQALVQKIDAIATEEEKALLK